MQCVEDTVTRCMQRAAQATGVPALTQTELVDMKATITSLDSNVTSLRADMEVVEAKLHGMLSPKPADVEQAPVNGNRFILAPVADGFAFPAPTKSPEASSKMPLPNLPDDLKVTIGQIVHNVNHTLFGPNDSPEAASAQTTQDSLHMYKALTERNLNLRAENAELAEELLSSTASIPSTMGRTEPRRYQQKVVPPSNHSSPIQAGGGQRPGHLTHVNYASKNIRSSTPKASLQASSRGTQDWTPTKPAPPRASSLHTPSTRLMHHSPT